MAKLGVLPPAMRDKRVETYLEVFQEFLPVDVLHMAEGFREISEIARLANETRSGASEFGIGKRFNP